MANLIVLTVHPPGFQATGICGGFILTSDSGEQMEIAFRRDWEGRIEDDVTAAVLNGMESTFVDIAANNSIAAFIDHVEKTYSNLIRSNDSFQVYCDLPFNEHAFLLRRSLLGESLAAIN